MASSPNIATGFPDLLDARFDEYWQERYPQQEDFMSKFFTMRPHTGKEDMRFSESSALEDIPEFTGEVSYQPRYEGYDTIATFVEFASGEQFERTLIDDQQFAIMDQRMQALADAVWRTRQRHGHRWFTMMHSNDTKFYVRSEGVAISSASHTNRTGASTASGFDNYTTSALTAVAVTATHKKMKKFLDSRGNIIEVTPDTIACGTDLYDKLDEIVDSSGKLDTDYNNSNVHKGKYKKWVSTYFNTNPNDWAMIDSAAMKKAFFWIDRIKPEYDTAEAFSTILWQSRVYMRYAMAITDWRPLHGADVAG